MSDIPSGNPLNSTDFDAALTKTAGDAYKIAIEGYAVEYQNQKGWYFDSQSGSSTDISDESLMFGMKETASFNIPLNVGSGQTNSGIVLAAGETANVWPGGTVVDTTVEGLLNVAAGGIADPTTIGSGGTEVVHRGGTDLGALISGGEQDVFGFASGATVFSGLQIVEFGGTASGTTVSSGGTLELLGGASASGFTIASGGTFEIASSYVLNDQQLLSNATVAIARGGTEVVSSGSTASNTTVSSGGTLVVSSGGLSETTTILNGGK